MADFAALQDRFDNDPTLSRKFLSDPVGVLKSEGIDVTPQQAFELQRSISEINKSGPQVSGSKVDVSVSISIRF